MRTQVHSLVLEGALTHPGVEAQLASSMSFSQGVGGVWFWFKVRGREEGGEKMEDEEEDMSRGVESF